MHVSIRKLVILPLIALFISCTVTKRVHRPGFHIQWHKIERTQAQEEIEKQTHETKTIVLAEEIPSQLDKTIPMENPEAGMDTDLEFSSIHSIELVQNDPIKRNFLVEDKSKFESVFTTKNVLAKSKFQKSSRPLFWRMSAKSLRNTGIFFICLGGMFLFASMLVYFGAFSGNGDGAWLNFFLDLVNISGWFWLLFFILAIILVSYLFFLLVTYVFGGPTVGALVGLGLLAIGIFFYTLGNRREIEP